MLSELLESFVQPWYASLADPGASQLGALLTLLKGYSKTAYRGSFDAGSVGDVEAYRNAFPVSDYSSLGPYLTSMYTENEFRRRGVSRLIVQRALKWCMEHQHERVVLHASGAGRSLYEEFGFEPTTEMRLKF